MAEESDLEKTEAPSGRRLEKAREDGQIVRSRELGTFLLLVTGVAGLWLSGDVLYRGLTGVLRHSMGFDLRVARDPTVMVTTAADGVYHVLTMMLPIFGALIVVAILGSILLGGVVFTTKPLELNFSRFDPLEGVKRIFSLQTMVELAKAVIKAILVGGVGAWALWAHLDEMLGLANAAPSAAMAKALGLVALCATIVVASLLLLVVVDVPWQVWSYMKKLRMSKEELKQEHKDTEGDPHVKSRIRQQQRSAARRRMMASVPNADVVVTNPTHYAVALTYTEGQLGAPRVVAKCSGLVATRIRQLAAEHRVPILEAPPLARALYQHVELGHEIPTALYTAVAEVLAWVFQLRSWRTGMGAEPLPPDSLIVPPELDPLAAHAAAQGA